MGSQFSKLFSYKALSRVQFSSFSSLLHGQYFQIVNVFYLKSISIYLKMFPKQFAQPRDAHLARNLQYRH